MESKSSSFVLFKESQGGGERLPVLAVTYALVQKWTFEGCVAGRAESQCLRDRSELFWAHVGLKSAALFLSNYRVTRRTQNQYESLCLVYENHFGAS